ncbi:hypothetical protein KAFR_0I00860 [Kazachstania africana CBS 2517]|uniref:EamA domain-containing protein n=1 Tax=Kazachstania africana (strain ATCC 22294 / BCRC 22015 / CBS 2517 / CECT 1963 / NBRC 1671 / NRRL Y-8276) TaxID=1071382 RepID=H2AZR7_KAZAF|nr:hypothetical protein KAFR_0I00860 [Kazachstania africana CBS 2517]CCF59867.1 hypothetical protein KAFR_0I00860 [Kazachstania africana CBS 2517]
MKNSWFLGLSLIFIVVTLWVSSSFLLNALFDDLNYNKPFLITYLSVSSFSIYLTPWIKQIAMSSWKSGSFQIPSDTVITDNAEKESLLTSSAKSNESFTLKETIRLSFLFAVLWFSAAFTSNFSLSYTTVASQTILSSTSSFFTLFIGVLLSIESIDSTKLFGLVVSFMGIVILVTNSNADPVSQFHSNPYYTMIGNILALSSAFIYGVYSTLFKKLINKKLNIKLFFGFIGIFSLVTFWPVLLLLHVTKIEILQFPSNTKILSIVILNCSIAFISDICWAKAILLTNPLIVTMGLSFTIPFAILGDFLFKGNSNFNQIYLIGATLILTSFFFINQKEKTQEPSASITHYDSIV